MWSDKRIPMRIMTNQKNIRYSQPWTNTFDYSKFLMLYVEIQDEYTGLIKVIGFSKNELNDILGKEVVIKIDLENGNQMNITLKCMNSNESFYNQAQFSSQSTWTKSLRAESRGKTRYGSPQLSRIKQTESLHNTNLLLQQQHQHNHIPASSVTNLSEPLYRYSEKKGRESYNSNFNQSHQNISNYYNISQNNTQSVQTQTQIIKDIQKLDNHEFIKYKQMIKELSLLLDIPQECDKIVYAVQHLLKKYRKQSEQLMKLQCENEIITTQFQNLQILKNMIETKSEDYKQQIQQKLKNYTTLFEENVQLKNTLKEDLNKMIQMNIKIKELQKDETLISEINQLSQQINQVTQNIQQRQYEHAVLLEEVHLLNQ